MPVQEDIDLDLDLSSLEIEEDKPQPRTRRPRSDAGKPRGRARTSLLVEKLLIPWATVGMIISQPVPVTSTVWIQRGEPTIKAIIELCSPYPKMMAALEKVGQVGPASEIIQTAVLLFMALAVETGRIPPQHGLAKNTGITDLYNQFYAAEEPSEPQMEFPYAS